MSKGTSTGSVLANLTAQVMSEKTDAARKLTPVAGEVAAAPALPRWPSDLNGPGRSGGFMSHEAMRVASVDLRRHAASLLEIADALDAYSGMPSADAKIETIEEARARREKEADERIKQQAAADDNAPAHAPELVVIPEPDSNEEFKERFAQLSAEAQAHAFVNPLDEMAKQIIAEDRANAEVLTAVIDAIQSDEWKCPIHDLPGIVKTSPKSGREFVGCPTCNAFKR